MAFKDKVLAAVAANPGRTDRELTNMILGRRKDQQQVNGEARHLANLGLLRRVKRDLDGYIGNYLE
ncbi:MAG: hypothetical protein RIC87_12515 [Kiloniellales bacterium]